MNGGGEAAYRYALGVMLRYIFQSGANNAVCMNSRSFRFCFEQPEKPHYLAS